MTTTPTEDDGIDIEDLDQGGSTADILHGNELTDVGQRCVLLLKLLADETRFRIMAFLYRKKEYMVGALCEKLNQSQPAVSHHLALLRTAGILRQRRDGKHNFYSILPDARRQLKALGVFLNQDPIVEDSK